jgi:hypothetical protein
MDKKPISNTKMAVQIIGTMLFAPIAPIFLAADIVRNALRDEADLTDGSIFGECEITEYVERKLLGE